MDLFRAAMAGDVPRLRELLAQLPDVDASDNLGNTALHAAVRGDRQEVVRVLLEAGADPDASQPALTFL